MFHELWIVWTSLDVWIFCERCVRGLLLLISKFIFFVYRSRVYVIELVLNSKTFQHLSLAVPKNKDPDVFNIFKSSITSQVDPYCNCIVTRGRAQAIFHRIPRLESQYSHSQLPLPTNVLIKELAFLVISI